MLGAGASVPVHAGKQRSGASRQQPQEQQHRSSVRDAANSARSCVLLKRIPTHQCVCASTQHMPLRLLHKLSARAHAAPRMQVDGTRNKVLLKRFAVTGYPTIYLLRGGSTWVYDGHRSVKEVRPHCRRRACHDKIGRAHV